MRYSAETFTTTYVTAMLMLAITFTLGQRN